MKNKFVISCVVIFMAVLTGYGTEGRALCMTKSSEIQQSVTAAEGNNSNDKTNTEIMIQSPEIVLDQFGYRYFSNVNGEGKAETKDYDIAIKNGEAAGIKGVQSSTPETIVLLEDAGEYVEDRKLYWLKNDYLKSCVENVFVNVSDDTLLISEYKTDAFRVKIYVFTAAEEGAEQFEFGRSYSSELYDVFEIVSDYVWQCFSYKDYENAEYTSAVMAEGDLVCEIQFENCDKQFIRETLESYKRSHDQ